MSGEAMIPVGNCTFCHRGPHDVKVIVVTRPGGPSICDTCTETAAAAIAEKLKVPGTEMRDG